MKNLIIAFFCLLILSGCEKQTVKPSIIGTWSLSRITTAVYKDSEVIFQADTILSNSNIFTFKDGGKGTFTNKADFIGLYNLAYDQTLNGGFNYSISSTEMDINFSAHNVPVKKQIVFLNSNQLIMHTEENIDADGHCDTAGAYNYVIDEYLFKQ